jgi:hypothetical protein
MTSRPRGRRAIDHFREESGIVMVPWIVWQANLPASARLVAMQLFHDPYRPLDRAFFESLPAYGINVERRMTLGTFRRAVARLRELGLVEGDRVPESLIRRWEDEWRKERGEARHWRRAGGGEGGEP